MWRQEYNGGLNVLLSLDSWCSEMFNIRGKMCNVYIRSSSKSQVMLSFN